MHDVQIVLTDQSYTKQYEFKLNVLGPKSDQENVKQIVNEEEKTKLEWTEEISNEINDENPTPSATQESLRSIEFQELHYRFDPHIVEL